MPNTRNRLGSEGKDLIEKERQNLRQQALKWMQADLKAIEELATKKPQQEAKFIAYALRQWRENVNLRYVREPEHLQKLPEAERTQWREFWTQAGNLIKKNDA